MTRQKGNDYLHANWLLLKGKTTTTTTHLFLFWFWLEQLIPEMAFLYSPWENARESGVILPSLSTNELQSSPEFGKFLLPTSPSSLAQMRVCQFPIHKWYQSSHQGPPQNSTFSSGPLKTGKPHLKMQKAWLLLTISIRSITSHISGTLWGGPRASPSNVMVKVLLTPTS